MAGDCSQQQELGIPGGDPARGRHDTSSASDTSRAESSTEAAAPAGRSRPSLDNRDASVIVNADSTGGTSHGSGNLPVILFNPTIFENMEALGIDVDDAAGLTRLAMTAEAKQLFAYAAFLSEIADLGRRPTVRDVELLAVLDRRLQCAIMQGIREIEGQVKAVYCSLMVEKLGPGCLHDPGGLNRENRHLRSLEAIERELQGQARSNASLRPWVNGRIPFDVAVSVASLGTLSKLV